MPMILNKTSIVCAILILVSSALVLQYRVIAKAHAENRALHKQIEQLAELVKRNQRPTSEVAPEIKSQEIPKEQFLELLRLRGEVGVLRRQKVDSQQLQFENQRLLDENRQLKAVRNQPVEPDFQFAERGIKKASWTFVGRSEPDATIQSFLWATVQGDISRTLECFTPEAQLALQKKSAGTSEAEIARQLREAFAKVKSFYVLENRMISNDEVILSVALEGASDPKVTLKRIGTEWKIQDGF